VTDHDAANALRSLSALPTASSPLVFGSAGSAGPAVFCALVSCRQLIDPGATDLEEMPTEIAVDALFGRLRPVVVHRHCANEYLEEWRRSGEAYRAEEARRKAASAQLGAALDELGRLLAKDLEVVLKAMNRELERFAAWCRSR
jgi:hypothetical protein